MINRKVLSAWNDLRVVARAGAGYDRVDVEAATEVISPHLAGIDKRAPWPIWRLKD